MRNASGPERGLSCSQVTANETQNKHKHRYRRGWVKVLFFNSISATKRERRCHKTKSKCKLRADKQRKRKYSAQERNLTQERLILLRRSGWVIDSSPHHHITTQLIFPTQNRETSNDITTPVATHCAVLYLPWHLDFPFHRLSADIRILGKVASWTSVPPWGHCLPSCIYQRSPFGSGTLSRGTAHCAHSAHSESCGTSTFW